MFHVAWLCHQACVFYAGKLDKRQMRNLLIATIFHDFDHSGMAGDDDLNIERAVRHFIKHIALEDSIHGKDIISLIKATEYPYTTAPESLDLSGKIIRDADLGQAFSGAWIQQVIFGLSAEWGKKPIEVLKAQSAFLKNLKFNTVWAQRMFSQTDIDAKIAEAAELVALLETKTRPVVV